MAYDRSFQIDKDVWGCIHTFDLKENGASIKLTNENRQGMANRFVWLKIKTLTWHSQNTTVLSLDQSSSNYIPTMLSTNQWTSSSMLFETDSISFVPTVQSRYQALRIMWLLNKEFVLTCAADIPTGRSGTTHLRQLRSRFWCVRESYTVRRRMEQGYAHHQVS